MKWSDNNWGLLLRRWKIFNPPSSALKRRRVGIPLAVFLTTFMIGGQLDIAERFTEWAAASEHLEIDELPAAVLAAAISFAALAVLERRLYQREVEHHRETSKKLHEAMELATNANTSKSAFMASMSHELRTPLNAIIGFSDFIRHGTLGQITPHKYSDYMNDIHKSSEHLLNLVEKMLDISKIEAGKYDLQRETVPLMRLADEAGRIVNNMATERDVRVNVDIPDELEIFADPQAARQILINLLSNAVKFNRTGGRVAVKAIRDPDRTVSISISDTGSGIDRKMLGHVFEPFALTSPHQARRNDGFGLGLSIVKRLTELHGGNVSIDSQPGHGATVTVRLPDQPVDLTPSNGNAYTPAYATAHHDGVAQRLGTDVPTGSTG